MKKSVKLGWNVLERLSTYNVKINVDKCTFFEETVDYLEHTLFKAGISP